VKILWNTSVPLPHSQARNYSYKCLLWHISQNRMQPPPPPIASWPFTPLCTQNVTSLASLLLNEARFITAHA
jgi:hypothetical protein